MTKEDHEIRRAIVDVAHELDRRGLVERSSGNVSVRYGELVMITPTGLPHREMEPEHIVVVDHSGQVVEGELGPSVETGMHIAVYGARPDANAVIHTHPVHASAFAAARQPIPAFLDEMAVYLGGDVEVTDYAMSGSPDLAEQAVKALGNRACCLLASHGMLSSGVDLDEALHVSALAERAAQTLLGALQLGGPVPLPEDMNELFTAYYRGKHDRT
jgi:L-fuculose-phosphate aldolase